MRNPVTFLHRALDAYRNEITESRIVFHHIPKCGGTSINAVFAQRFGWRASVLGKNIFRIKGRASSAAAQSLGLPLARFRAGLLSYALFADQYRYISGHVPFCLDLWDSYRDRYDFITILREPRSRFVSNYFFNRRLPGWAKGPDLDLDLPDFLETPEAARFGSRMTRYLAGPDAEERDGGPRLLEAAKANLEKFDIVGQLEDMDGFARRLSERYGVPFDFGRENVGTGRNSAPPSPETIARIDELCAPDRELYEHAAARFGWR